MPSVVVVISGAPRRKGRITALKRTRQMPIVRAMTGASARVVDVGGVEGHCVDSWRGRAAGGVCQNARREPRLSVLANAPGGPSVA